MEAGAELPAELGSVDVKAAAESSAKRHAFTETAGSHQAGDAADVPGDAPGAAQGQRDNAWGSSRGSLNDVSVAVARGAKGASHACLQVVAERLHAAVQGWERAFGQRLGAAEAGPPAARAGGWLQVVLRVIGKGSCEQGAAVCLCACATCADRGASSGEAGTGKAGNGTDACACVGSGDGRVVGFVTSAACPALGGWVGGRATLSAAAVGAARGEGLEAAWRRCLYILNPYAPACRRRVAVL